VSRAQALSAALAALAAVSLGACKIERVNVSSTEEQSNNVSNEASISRDGRYVAFDSQATNLAPGDGVDDDIFLRDRVSGTTTIVSAGTNGDAAVMPEISASGRYVAFASGAKLVSEDTNIYEDVFVWDRETGATTRASVSSTGGQGDSASPVGGQQGSGISINRNGRFVAFTSVATNLAPGDDNGIQDIFVRDRVAGTTVRVPAESTGEPATETDGSKLYGLGNPAISLDGRYLAFNTIRAISTPGGAFLRDGTDVYVRDLQTGATTRVTTGAFGQANFGVAIDRDGTHVAFSSAVDSGPGTGDIYVRNLRTGTVVRVRADSTADPGVYRITSPSLSRSGRFLAFSSDFSSESPGGLIFTQIAANVYVRDIQTGETRRISKNANPQPGSGYNIAPRLSADGRWLTWVSTATNLVDNDTNDEPDVFVAPARPLR
jgi:Tol biopolymer transport system component